MKFNITRTLFFLLLLFVSVGATAQKNNEVKPTNADEYYDESVKQAKLRNYKYAISLAKEGLKRRSNFMDMHLLIGKLYTITKNYDSARYHIKYVINNDPRYKDAYFYAINIEASTGHYEEALCYADDALYFFPNDKELLLKKLSLLQETNRSQASRILAQKIIDRYPSDAKVVSAFVEHKLSLGRYYLKRGSLNEAKNQFENALAADPSNREALNALYNIELRSGNYQAALNRINYALIRNPNSYDLLMTKLGIEQSSHAYAEALETLKTIYKYYPNDTKARFMEREIRLQAARFYTAMDPLSQYLSILEKEPGNREALHRVIGINDSRGNTKQALYWVNQGILRYGNDATLLGQKVDILEQQRNFTEAAHVAQMVYRIEPTLTWRNRVVELSVLSAQQYASQQMYDSALAEIDHALRLNKNNIEAMQKKINILIALKSYDEALELVDEYLDAYPGDDRTWLTKSSLIEAMGNQEEAADLTAQLLEKDPNNRRVTSIYIEQRMTAARALMQAEEFDLARTQLRYVYQLNPQNLEALNYLINLESATGNFDSALYYADQALALKPTNKDLLLKKSSIFEQMQQYPEAYAITEALMIRYPYNLKIKRAYIDQVLASGKYHQKNQQLTEALTEYNKALLVAPKDTVALMYAVNVLNETKNFDSALVLINRGLEYYPQSEYFHLKKAVVLEQMNRIDMAALHADTASKINPTQANINYANYLKSFAYKNEFGLYYLRSSFDDPYRKGNIGTVEYRRYNRKGSFAGRVNYAGRANGTGYQFDLEMYRNHGNTKNYSHAVASASIGEVFPKYRLSYSYLHNFQNKWEGEIGGRYLRTVDSTDVYGPTLAVSRYLGDFWFNLRGYWLFANYNNQTNSYQSYALTNRYYMNDQLDYVQLFFGLGSLPDEISQNFNLGSTLDFVTTTIGAAYLKTIRYRTRVGINLTWINQKVAPNLYRNQYDVYLTLQRRF